MVNDKRYWEGRMIQLFNAQDKQNDTLNALLQKEYQRVGANIDKEIASYYAKYGAEDVIEYRKLVVSLSQSERDLLYKDMEAFALKYPQYAELLPVRESIYQLNRLEGLQLSVRQNLLELGAIEQQVFDKALADAYERGYLCSMKGLENPVSFFKVDPLIMQQTINAKWVDGKNFSDRIWDNKERLIRTMNNEIRDGLIRGDSYRKMIKTIEHRTGIGGSDAKRLLMTEAAFVLNSANAQAFMDAGILEYEISAVMDSRTSPTCRHMDGQIFKFSERVVGVNAPPFHSYCRSTIVPIELDVTARGKARHLLEEAVKQEPQVTNDLLTTSKQVGAKLEGLEFRIKSLESLVRKITKEPDAKIRDVLRYTVVADSDDMTDMFAAFVENISAKGYNINAVKNYWNNPTNPYNGINANFLTPDKFEFELQFHTPESFEMKNGKLHELYEKARVITDTESQEYIRLQGEMFELSENMEKPKDIESVKDVR